MWSLPDINKMNKRAAEKAGETIEAAERGPDKEQECEVYHCGEKAENSEPWFDIFSDDPKGLTHVCSEHCSESVEGFFRCEDCHRLVIDHYTWERYEKEGKCLKCAAEAYFVDRDNWIEPVKVNEVVFNNQPDLFIHGKLNLRRAEHVLGVRQPTPEGLEFVDNAEFDSCDGHQISGDKVLDIIKRCGDKKVCVVLDAAYQFAVSIGVYIRK